MTHAGGMESRIPTHTYVHTHPAPPSTCHGCLRRFATPPSRTPRVPPGHDAPPPTTPRASRCAGRSVLPAPPRIGPGGILPPTTPPSSITCATPQDPFCLPHTPTPLRLLPPTSPLSLTPHLRTHTAHYTHAHTLHYTPHALIVYATCLTRYPPYLHGWLADGVRLWFTATDYGLYILRLRTSRAHLTDSP